MSKREYIARYNLIINFLRRQKANFQDIALHLERESEIQGHKFSISQRTFQRDIDEIRSIYNIDITCDKSTSFYSILDHNEEATHHLRMLESLDLYNALNLSSGFTEFIQFDNRKPKGTEYIYGFLNAIKNRNTVVFTYQKFYETDSETIQFEPYLIKEFKGRWYVLGNVIEKQSIRTYGLDRILSFEVKRKRYNRPKDFNPHLYFQNAFGIICFDDSKPEKITFSFDAEQGKYIKNYPLHNSQKIIVDNEKEMRFEITVFITYDLIMELLSHAGNINILSPPALVKELSEILAASLKTHKKHIK